MLPMSSDFDIAIGQKIRRFRKLKGLTQQQVAHILRLSFQQVQKYEQGTNKISFERLCQLSMLLQVRLEAWLDQEITTPVGGEHGNRQALVLLQSFHAIANEEK